jgi:DASH complex subunit DAM1
MQVDLQDSTSKRSSSRTRTSRPTTPLRPSSRSSFRESARGSVAGGAPFPLNTFEPAFAELSDAVADLEANLMHFQLMHESLARFSESFASFMYGLNMNAFCIDFPEVCTCPRERRPSCRALLINCRCAGPNPRIFSSG